MTRLSPSIHPAYHLRPNKAVDRLLFMELLAILRRSESAFPRTYIGLGGPFLEDFRLLSQEFPNMQLICIEQDYQTHLRQKFHVCASSMRCVQSTLSEYVARSFPSENPVAVWADYTGNVRREYLSEIADISRKAVPGSILRVTLRAESPAIGWSRDWGRDLSVAYPPAPPAKLKAKFEREKIKHEIDMKVDRVAFDPQWFSWSNFSVEEYPRMLARIVGAVVSGACTRPKSFLPLHVVKYSDGTIMLSITGLICREDARDSLTEHFRAGFRFLSSAIDNVDVIDVPTLTTKERLHLDEILPTKHEDGRISSKRLGYLVEGEGSEAVSARKMEQYERYYRLYPYFGKLAP